MATNNHPIGSASLIALLEMGLELAPSLEETESEAERTLIYHLRSALDAAIRIKLEALAEKEGASLP